VWSCVALQRVPQTTHIAMANQAIRRMTAPPRQLSIRAALEGPSSVVLIVEHEREHATSDEHRRQHVAPTTSKQNRFLRLWGQWRQQALSFPFVWEEVVPGTLHIRNRAMGQQCFRASTQRGRNCCYVYRAFCSVFRRSVMVSAVTRCPTMRASEPAPAPMSCVAVH
jgi:hypothetical protein